MTHTDIFTHGPPMNRGSSAHIQYKRNEHTSNMPLSLISFPAHFQLPFYKQPKQNGIWNRAGDETGLSYLVTVESG